MKFLHLGRHALKDYIVKVDKIYNCRSTHVDINSLSIDCNLPVGRKVDTFDSKMPHEQDTLLQFCMYWK